MSVSRRGSGRGAPKYPRVARVNQLLQEVVAEAIERFSNNDSRLDLTTVTSIETEPNLSSATVYIANLNSENAKALEQHRIRIQNVVATQVRMKRTPRLSFAQDVGVANGDRIDAILRRISDGDSTFTEAE